MLSKFEEYSEALKKVEASIKESEGLRSKIIERILSEANRYFYNTPQAKKFTIPDSCRIWGLVNNRPTWFVPQDKEIPEKYWGITSQHRVIQWYEE